MGLRVRVVPDTVTARNVFEHFDDYTIGLGSDKTVGVPTQFYSRGAVKIDLHVGPLVIDVDKARKAAGLLASVVIAGRDYLRIPTDESKSRGWTSPVA
jgi:hypothetical protein